MNKEQISIWIDGIISDLTDPSKTLEDCLRKTLVLAFKLKNDKLKTWAEYELNGYPTDDSIPEYRLVGLEVWGDVAQATFGGILRRTNSLYFEGSNHPVFVELRKGYPLTSAVASLESIFKPKGKEIGTVLSFTINPNAAQALGKLYPGWTVEKAWVQISEFTITATLSQIKNNLLQFLLNLNEEMGSEANYSIMSNSSKIDSIMEHTIGHIHAENVTFGSNYQTKGNQNNVVQGNNNAQEITSSETLHSEIREFIKQLQSTIEKASDIELDTKEEVSGQITIIEKQVNKDKPNFGIIGKSLELIESLLLDAVTSEYTPLILEGIRRLLPQLSS